MNLKIVIALITFLSVTGCAHELALHPRDGGATFQGVANESGRKVELQVDGEVYKGTYVYDGGSVIIGNSTGFGVAGSSVIQSTGIYTGYAPGSGNGQIFARSPSGKSIRCEFLYKDGSGLGVCERSDGKVYDLQILN